MRFIARFLSEGKSDKEGDERSDVVNGPNGHVRLLLKHTVVVLRNYERSYHIRQSLSDALQSKSILLDKKVFSSESTGKERT